MREARCIKCGYTGVCNEIRLGELVSVPLCEQCSARIKQGIELGTRYYELLGDVKTFLKIPEK